MSDERCLSSLALDLAVVGAADEASRGHVERCARCRGRVDVRRREDAAFLASTPIAKAVADVERRASTPPARTALDAHRHRAPWVGAAVLAGALAASIAGAVLFVPPPTERAKGSTIADLFVDRDGTIARWSGQPLTEGDTLVFRYTSTKRFLLVLDVEGSGDVSVIVASADGTSAPIEPGRDRTAREGMRLDDYAGPERVIALFSDTPLEAAPLVERLRARVEALDAEARAALELGPVDVDADAVSWLVSKEAR